MNNGLFAQLSDAGSKLLGTVGENRFAFNTALRRTGFDSAGAMKDFKDYQQVQNEEMKNRLAALQLEKMIDSFQARIDGIALRVDDTNDYWDEYTEDSLTAAGFRREGTTFQKDIVTGSTITSPVIRELREIQQYQDMLYETPDLETASGIRNYGLVYDFDAVQALIANATKVVEAEEERVFGTGVREWRAKGGAWAERDEAPDLSKKKEQEKGWQNRGDGLFGKHVGYAPVYKSGYDVDMEKSRTKNIKYKGSGELGRILGYLSWYNMEEGAGYSQVNQPAWDKPLWDAYPLFGNEDWMMEAPSFAGAVDIVVQVVATVATAPVGGWGGAALGAAIGSVDDLLFTALELGTGYIIPEQALLQVGQTLLKAGVQVAAQGAFQGYEKQAGGLMAAWGKNFMGEATVNFLQQLTTNTLNGAIDAVELSYDDDGNLEGLGFDMERWGESVYGVRALAGYAGSFARSATQSLLKGTAVGFLGEGANNYNALIKTASALAGEGVGSLIDGEFSINVLNLTDILSPFIEDKELLAKMDMGLFSMNFARDKNGNLRTTSRINSAGANVGGLVGLARSVAGLTEAYDNIRIGLSGADEKTAIALRGISTNGQEASQSLFDQILSGETTLQEAYRVAVGEIAKTTSTADGKEISLNMEDLNGFELGVVLAHEAMRNGRNDGEEGQRLETIDAVLAHSDHAMQVLEKYGLGALGYQMVQEAIDYAKMQNGEISQEDFEAYVDGKYDSSADFWKLTKDGKLEYDGKGWLTDEDGKYILSDGRKVAEEDLTDSLRSLRIGAKGVEGGLAKILNISNLEAAQLLASSGFEEKAVGTWWKHDGNKEKYIDISMMSFGHLPAEIDYELQKQTGQLAQVPDGLAGLFGVNRDISFTEFKENKERANILSESERLTGVEKYSLLQEHDLLPQQSENFLGIFPSERDQTYDEWTLENAKNTLRNEIKIAFSQLEGSGWEQSRAAVFALEMSRAFSGVSNATSAKEMLEGFRTGLTQLKNNSQEDGRFHPLVLLTNQVFRGENGEMGLAEALRAQYQAEGNEEARGYTIQDVALTFQDQYLHMIYGLENETEAKVKLQFAKNYGGTGADHYGEHITGGFMTQEDGFSYWTEFSYQNPGVDCIGYVNLVYHTAGEIDDYQQAGYSVPAAWSSLSDLQQTDDPAVGSMVFMKGHIGLLGKDESNNWILMHSAPDPFYTAWNDLGHYESGPRVNSFNTSNLKLMGFSDRQPLTDTRYDDYLKRLIDRGYFSFWKDKYGNQFGGLE